MRALFIHARSRKDLLDSCQPQLLAVFTDKVLSSREQPSSEVLAAYRPLLASVSASQMAESVLPSVVRNIKRTPDVTLPTVEVLLEAADLDLSAHAAELLPVLVQQTRHAKETVRCASAEICCVLRFAH